MQREFMEASDTEYPPQVCLKCHGYILPLGGCWDAYHSILKLISKDQRLTELKRVEMLRGTWSTQHLDKRKKRGLTLQRKVTHALGPLLHISQVKPALTPRETLSALSSCLHDGSEHSGLVLSTDECLSHAKRSTLPRTVPRFPGCPAHGMVPASPSTCRCWSLSQ